jgi:hypothetical protein
MDPGNEIKCNLSEKVFALAEAGLSDNGVRDLLPPNIDSPDSQIKSIVAGYHPSCRSESPSACM